MLMHLKLIRRLLKITLLHLGIKEIFFIGYPSSIFSYAKIANELAINDISFKAIISLGDKLFSHYRKTIEDTFNTEIFDTYGGAEGLMIAGECSEHRYHILSTHVYVEILDANGDIAPDGELGEVVVTSLDNYLMPLIRYKIGDLAIQSKKILLVNAVDLFLSLIKLLAEILIFFLHQIQKY